MMWTEKYRPKSIDEIVGHDDIKKRLKGFVESNTLPHLLFAGPPGTGKTTAVLALARDLFKNSSIEGNVLELNASDERGIDVIRNQVKSFARIMPMGDAPFKIISLDEADALTPAAQHALRRTMEKYVKTSRFILLCNYPGKIIEPIQSRCAFFRFSRLNDTVIKSRLKFIADSERVTINEEGINTIIDISEGDMRKAINILQAAAATGTKLTGKTILNTIGAVNSDEIKIILDLAINKDYKSAKNKLQELLYIRGVSGDEIIRNILKELSKLSLPPSKEIKMIELLAEVDYRISEGASPDIQLFAVLARLSE